MNDPHNHPHSSQAIQIDVLQLQKGNVQATHEVFSGP